MLVRRVAALLVIGLVLDLAFAQVAKRVLPDWYVLTPANNPRVPSPVYHHGLRPLVDVTHRELEQRYRFATNSLGMVDAEPRAVDPKAPGCRVLVIGDSFTEGYGVGWEKSFAGLLSARWKGQEIELLNAGTSGYAPTIYYRKVRHLLEDEGVRFDAVLAVIDMSDIRDEWMNYDLDAQDRVVQISDVFPTTVMRPAKLFDHVAFAVIDNSTVANTIYRILLRLGWRPAYHGKHAAQTLPIDVRPHSPPRPLPLGAVSVAPPHGRVDERSPRRFVKDYGYWALDARDWENFGRDGLQVAGEHMDRLVMLLRKHGIPLTISVHPWPANLAAGDKESIQVTFWRDWARARGVGFVNLFPVFFAAGDNVIKSHFLDNDFHWNAQGNALVVDEIQRQFDPQSACRPAPIETAAPPVNRQ